MTEWVYTKTIILFNLGESGRIVTSLRIFCRYSPRFQRIIVNYCEKQIGFTLLTTLLHLLSNSSPTKTWLSTQNRIFSSTSINTTLMVQVRPNRKSLDNRYIGHFQNHQKTLCLSLQKNIVSIFSWDFLWSQEIKAILRGQPIYFGGGGMVDFEKKITCKRMCVRKRFLHKTIVPSKIVILQTLWNNLLNCQSLIVK